jgi:hypothetical protein
MKLALWILIVFFLSAPALACPAHAQEASIRQFCQRLPDHKPSADVNYQPGVDVKGRAVMPADINTSMKSTLNPIQVPVTVDLAQGLNIPAGTEMDGAVAILNIYEDGSVDYNGQDITSNARYACESLNHEQPEKSKNSHHTNP